MSTLEHTGHYRDLLEDIRHWYGQLPDLLTATAGASLDLTGVRGTTDRIPGGDILAMLTPWAPDADYGDPTPHPDQIITEWSHTIHDAHDQIPDPHATWAQHWRYLHDQTPWILDSHWADDWTTDITALRQRLATLTGNLAPEPPTQRTATDCQNVAALIPDDTRLTARDADRFWPGIEARLKDDRHHRRPTPTRHPDRTYQVGDLRTYYGVADLQNRATHGNLNPTYKCA